MKKECKGAKAEYFSLKYKELEELDRRHNQLIAKTHRWLGWNNQMLTSAAEWSITVIASLINKISNSGKMSEDFV